MVNEKIILHEKYKCITYGVVIGNLYHYYFSVPLSWHDCSHDRTLVQSISYIGKKRKRAMAFHERGSQVKSSELKGSKAKGREVRM